MIYVVIRKTVYLVTFHFGIRALCLYVVSQRMYLEKSAARYASAQILEMH